MVYEIQYVFKFIKEHLEAECNHFRIVSRAWAELFWEEISYVMLLLLGTMGLRRDHSGMR
jgi:hypothetical protein